MIFPEQKQGDQSASASSHSFGQIFATHSKTRLVQLRLKNGLK